MSEEENINETKQPQKRAFLQEVVEPDLMVPEEEEETESK